MRANPAKKKILVLSDNDKVTKVIRLTLNGDIEVQVARTAPRPQEQSGCDDVDLIVVATSSHTSEPVVELARSALTGYIGRVPLLIISDRPFAPDPQDRITHLSFPFQVDELRDRVRELLKQPVIVH